MVTGLSDRRLSLRHGVLSGPAASWPPSFLQAVLCTRHLLQVPNKMKSSKRATTCRQTGPVQILQAGARLSQALQVPPAGPGVARRATHH